MERKLRMSYQALYRVWRPRKFSDVVGQTHITRTLQNAISQQKFSHAYLFSGPRGTGKTSAAKIFAQAVNCEKMPAKEPCNECQACLGILDGSISDVIEIDAASNTSVDDIREIRDKVKYAPSAVPYKVYIIDEVHMISVNAFNALLKTLEEPPAHVIFILATTEAHKIPLTIISRCQRFDFKPINNHAIVSRMQEIVASENVDVTKEALESIALSAEGGMRDALSILDQAISYAEDQVQLKDVLAVTGGVSQKAITMIVQSMYEQDIEKSLFAFDEIIQQGKDPSRFVFDLIYFLRDLLLYKGAPNLEDVLDRAIVDESFKALAADVSVPWIQRAMKELNKCQQDIKWTNHPKVFIEIALLSITNQYEQKVETGADDLQPLLERMKKLERELTTLKQKPVETVRKTEVKKQAPRNTKNTYNIPYEQIRGVLGEAKRAYLQDVTQKWASFLTHLKSVNAPAHATIQDSKPVAASDQGLVVAFRYEIHCSLFLDNKETVESILSSEIGKELTIIPIPEKSWHQLRDEYVKKQETPKKNEQEETDPLIEEARKLVGDDLIQIHD